MIVKLELTEQQEREVKIAAIKADKTIKQFIKFIVLKEIKDGGKN